MTISDKIRMLCARVNISNAELCRRTGQSQQNLSSKLKKGSFTINDCIEMAEAVGATFEYNFVFEETNERI